MSEKYKPVKGDRVRVVLEGEVTYADECDPWFNLEGKQLYSDGRAVVSVERIEPPVEVFKVGDVVRTIGGDQYNNHWLITEDGYVNGFGRLIESPDHEFTSRNFELVSKGRL